MSDVAEAKRFTQLHGLGDEIYIEDPTTDQDLADMFFDLGMEVNNDRDT